MKDRNGRIIQEGDSVLVPDPLPNDLYNHEFVGTVDGFHGEYVIVGDSEGDYFDIEPDRLEIIDE